MLLPNNPYFPRKPLFDPPPKLSPEEQRDQWKVLCRLLEIEVEQDDLRVEQKLLLERLNQIRNN